MKAILLVTVATGLLLSSLRAHDDLGHRQVAQFSQLPRTDRLEITYVALDCFGPGMHVELTYYPLGHGEFEVREKQFSRRDRGKKPVFVLVPLGAITLEADEAGKLDQLIAAYRQPKNSNLVRLSGNVTVTIRQLRNHKLIAEETFHNPEDNRDLPRAQRLDFGMFVDALKKA